jgi:hypothetical protein
MIVDSHGVDCSPPNVSRDDAHPQSDTLKREGERERERKRERK